MAAPLLLAALLGTAPPLAAVPADEPYLGYQPKAGENFQRRFFFHRPETTIEEARADLAECGQYARDAMFMAKLPLSMPPDPKLLPPSVNNGGLGPVASGLVFALIAPGEVGKMVAANMRKCMGFKGYDRYGLSEPLWQQLNEGPADEALLRQARLASGGRPAGRKLDQ